MPAYIYADSVRIVQLGFINFVLNSVIVIGFAMVAQVFLCSISAFVISKELSPKAGRVVLLFFLGAMMIPFASIMLPQLLMYKRIGAYNNYAALLLPFLYLYGFYVYLYKVSSTRFRVVISKQQRSKAQIVSTSTRRSVCHCLSRSSH